MLTAKFSDEVENFLLAWGQEHTVSLYSITLVLPQSIIQNGRGDDREAAEEGDICQAGTIAVAIKRIEGAVIGVEVSLALHSKNDGTSLAGNALFDSWQDDLSGGIAMTQQLLERAAEQELRSTKDYSGRVLQGAARLWFVVAVLGQWMMVAYVVAFYGGAAVQGELARWNKVLAGGYIPGDRMGNLVLAIHLFLAVIITVGGPLQLIPQLRAILPGWHRWNGRIYLFTAYITSTAGLYLVWIRGGSVGEIFQHLGVSLDAVLIMICSGMALRYALARNFGDHRRWALRLFLVVSGVWFFRVGLMLWLIVNRGPAGFDPKTFQGPFLSFLSFADYLVPLAVLEIYLRVKARSGSAGKYAMAVGLLILTIAMGVGIFGATMGMWLPRMKG